MKLYSLVVLSFAIIGSHGLDNGLARTPPMGWLSWLKFECNINEKLYKDMVDRIVEDGYLELGYNTVNIDDCWSEMRRDPTTNRLVPDHKRFPNGIKGLVDYARAKGVSIGIYGDIGFKTCAGYPGTRNENFTIDYTKLDAQTFAEWGVDSLKMDGCKDDSKPMIYSEAYSEYSQALDKQCRFYSIKLFF